jgi:hypothetical protein
MEYAHMGLMDPTAYPIEKRQAWASEALQRMWSIFEEIYQESSRVTSVRKPQIRDPHPDADSNSTHDMVQQRWNACVASSRQIYGDDVVEIALDQLEQAQPAS